jgi:hypothetical protein
MRHFRRSFQSKTSRILIFAVALSVLAGLCALSPPANGQAAAGTANTLPAAWSDAVKALADRVAASVSPAHPVALTVKNISSVGASEVDALRAAIEAQLAQHHFRFARTTGAATAAETRIDVTLSESDADYVWVAEIHTKGDAGDPDVAVVNVTKVPGGSGVKTATLTLQKTLVWQQAAPFLDFRVAADASNPGAPQRLTVLEPSKLAFYTQSGGQWQSDGVALIAHRSLWPRDVRGTLAPSSATATVATISSVPCTGTAAKGGSIVCNGTPVSDDAPAAIPGHDAGETLTLATSCDGGAIALASGTGDWTQADAIHGYVVTKSQAAAGGTLEFDGPVLALEAGSASDPTTSARAVVRNLKTGNYEGYIVTATCGQ